MEWLHVASVVAFFLLPRAKVTFCKGVAAVAGPLDWIASPSMYFVLCGLRQECTPCSGPLYHI